MEVDLQAEIDRRLAEARQRLPNARQGAGQHDSHSSRPYDPFAYRADFWSRSR